MSCSKWLFLVLALLSGAAHAQTDPGFVSGTLTHNALNAAFITKCDAQFGACNNMSLGSPTISGGNLTNVSINSANLLGTMTGGTLSGTTLINASFVGSTGTPNQTSISCGVTNTLLLSASQAAAFIAVKIPAGVSGGPVWFNYAGTNAVAAPPSVDILAGQEIVWSTANGFLPTSAINCIAASSPVTVTLMYK